MELFKVGRDMTHLIQFINYLTDKVLNFLKFNHTGFVNPHVVRHRSSLVNYRSWYLPPELQSQHFGFLYP